MSVENSLKAENQRIFDQWRKDGLDLSITRQLEFFVALKNKPQCLQFRSTYISTYGLPKSGVFVVVNDPSEFGLSLVVEMKPDIDRVTEFEHQLKSVAEEFDGPEVSWGFFVDR